MSYFKRENNELIQLIIRENEPKANQTVAKTILVLDVSICCAVAMFLSGFVKGATIETYIMMISSIVLSLGVSLMTLLHKGHKVYLKYLLLIALTLMIWLFNFMTGFKCWLFCGLPIVISLRYQSKRTTYFISIISMVMCYAAVYVNAYISPKIGIYDLNVIKFAKPGSLSYWSNLYKPVIEAGFDKWQTFQSGIRLVAIPNTIIMIIFTIVTISIINSDNNNYVTIKKVTEEKIENEIAAKRATNHLNTYVGEQTTKVIMYNDDSKELSVNYNAAIMFADLQGFTSFSEGREPLEVITILNDYLAIMSDYIEKNNGLVDKFIGDCTMGVFDGKDGCLNALKAAFDMQTKSKQISALLKEKYNADIMINIGIHYGSVVEGEVGSKTRKNITAIGDVVNTAARLQQKAHDGEICFSNSVYNLVKQNVRAKGPIKLQLKGKSEIIESYILETII